MSEGESPEVRIKLVADDHTATTVLHVKEGMEDISHAAHDAEEAVKKAAHGSTLGLDNLKTAAKSVTGETEGISKMAGLIENPYLLAAGAAIAVGFAVHEAYGFAKDLAEEALKAASAAEKQERAMTGVMMLMKSDYTMKELREGAKDYREELELVGLKSGQSVEKMTGIFDKLVEGGAVGTEKAKELAGAMAQVGRFSRGGPDVLAQGYLQLERGQASARNEMVKFIAATHTLEGNAKSVAKQMQHMSTEAKLALADKAIAKMQTKVGDVPLNLGELHTTFAGVKEAFFTSMGQPMLDKLLPPLNELKVYILNHLEGIQEFGEAIGEKFGEAFETAADISREVYGAIVQNWQGIVDSSKEITDPLMETWEYIYNNKEAFAKTFADISKDMMGWITALFHAIGGMFSMLAKAAEVLGITHTREDAVQKQYIDLMSKPHRTKEEEAALDKLKGEYTELTAGTNRGGTAGADLDAAASHHTASQEQIQELDLSANANDAESVVHMYNEALKNHQDGMAKYAAELIMSHEEIRKGMLEGKDIVVENMKEFGKMIANPEFFKELKESKKVKIDAHAAHNDFRGSQFHIKQDFRDQDPDRVALVFRRDIMRAAVARGGSSQGTPGAVGL